MSQLVRAAALLAFALAYLAQPLALDACAVSCEAARAARSAAIAAPCHHSTSCAAQIAQPSSSGSAAGRPPQAPSMTAVLVAMSESRNPEPRHHLGRASRPPDAPRVSTSSVPLRI